MPAPVATKRSTRPVSLWRDLMSSAAGVIVTAWPAGDATQAVVDGQKMRYYLGDKVDSADVLPDGRRFTNIDEYRRFLLADKDQLARNLTVRLVTYATGAAPTDNDDAAINQIVAQCREKNYGFRSLIHAIVASGLFQTK